MMPLSPKQLSNRRLKYILSLEESPKTTITHFATDKLKQVGHYEQTTFERLTNVISEI